MRTARSEMSDARLSGAVTVTDNADRFVAGTDDFLGDVLWGTVAIENDQGTWTGPLTGTSDPSAEGRGVSYIELVGAGAYEGLSAILFEREMPLAEGDPRRLTGTASSSLATCRPTVNANICQRRYATARLRTSCGK